MSQAVLFLIITHNYQFVAFVFFLLPFFIFTFLFNQHNYFNKDNYYYKK